MGTTNTIIIFLGCIMAILLFGRILVLPLRVVIKLIFNSLLGGLIIVLINLIGGMFGFHIGLNLITSIFVRNSRNSWGNTFDNI